MPRNVVVTGVDDPSVDGDAGVTITTDPAVSDDTTYNGLDIEDVDVINLDDDVAAVSISVADGLSVSESGETASFTVSLTSLPTGDVTIPIMSSSEQEGVVDSEQLVFTTEDWNIAQTVTVRGVDDLLEDGDQSLRIITGIVESSDDDYDGIDPDDVALVNLDNDIAGVTVNRNDNLETTEAGSVSTFAVVLNTKPTHVVTIPISSTNRDEGVPSVERLVFTLDNWNTPQSVEVMGVDDQVDDGDQAFTIVIGNSFSDDTLYQDIVSDDISFSNIDDDTSGITVHAELGLQTSEAGSTTSFTVVLDSLPTHEVAIPISSSRPGEGTTSVEQLVFTAVSWSVPQTVTVSGVDDFIDDGDQTYSIITGSAVSNDLKYSTIDAVDVEVSNTDDDTAGITVNADSNLETSESGESVSFTVVLDSMPTDEVVVPIASSLPGEGTVSVDQLVFSTSNWNVAQTVSVAGVDDFIDDDDQVFSILTGSAVSDDLAYATIDAIDVEISNADDDTAGITVSADSNLQTSESGESVSFTVVLDSMPTDEVVVPITSSSPDEGTVSVEQLVFSTSNWNVPQAVTVAGVDDSIDDGDQIYSILTGSAVSDDLTYSTIDAVDIAVSNADDDTAGITVSADSNLRTSESGDSVSFTVILDSMPTHEVVVPISSSSPGEGTVSVEQLVFSASNWNVAQAVTVSGVDDSIDDGDQSYSIVLGTAESEDALYSAIDAADVLVGNVDDDTAGITVNAGSDLITTEAGDVVSFTVALNSSPAQSVTIPITSSNSREGTVSVSQLIFSEENWNLPQTVSVTGVDDQIDDGDMSFVAITGSALSEDPNYKGVDAADVSITNADDDSASVVVSKGTGDSTSESGGSVTFDVVLSSRPTSDVTLPMESSVESEGSVSTESLVFTVEDWNVAQQVTVTGVDDFADDGDQTYSLLFLSAISEDPSYANVDPDDLALTNIDDDEAAVTVTAASNLTTTETGQSITFTVKLDSQPSSDVVIPLAVSDSSEASLSSAGLLFTPNSWGQTQVVTVTGLDDDIDDDDIEYTVTIGSVQSDDPLYASEQQFLLSVLNIDDEHLPFQNTSEPLDVNNDDRVTAFDALLIVNDVNVRGARTLPDEKSDVDDYYDVNGDGKVSLIDPLIIINGLFRFVETQSEPEFVPSADLWDNVNQYRWNADDDETDEMIEILARDQVLS